MNRHTIETLQWSCHGGDRRRAVATQQRLRDFIMGEGAVMLERTFDRLSLPGQVWRIDQLEIDMGHLPIDAEPDTWARHLERAIDTALRRIQPSDEGVSHSASDDRDLDRFLYYIQYGRLHWSMPTLVHGSLADWLSQLTQRCGSRLWVALRRLPHPDRAVRRLGQITPHHGLHALLASRHAELARALGELDDTLLEPLRAQGRLGTYQLGQLRLAWRVAGLHALWTSHGSHLGVTRLHQLMDALRDSLLSHLGKAEVSSWALRLRSASSGADFGGLRRSLFLGLQLRFLRVRAARSEEPSTDAAASPRAMRAQDEDPRELMPAAWHESLRQFALLHQAHEHVRDAGLGLSALQIYLFDYSVAYLGESKRIPQDHVAWHKVWLEGLAELIKIDPNLPFGAMPADQAMVPQGPPGEARPTVRGKPRDGTISPDDDYPGDEAIYIANAGLVLLANFAPRLFALLGLTRDDAFIDEAAQHRAVHCLVYLSDGHTRSEEHEWVLNKILCGLPIDVPIPPAEPLRDTLSVVDSLLPSVVAHWRALGQTSPDGLRQTFLRRIGRLVEHESFEGEHWRLKVQPSAFDVLLDRLPWSYTTIRLPWMRGVIHVEWR